MSLLLLHWLEAFSLPQLVKLLSSVKLDCSNLLALKATKTALRHLFVKTALELSSRRIRELEKLTQQTQRQLELERAELREMRKDAAEWLRQIAPAPHTIALGNLVKRAYAFTPTWQEMPQRLEELRETW